MAQVTAVPLVELAVRVPFRLKVQLPFSFRVTLKVWLVVVIVVFLAELTVMVGGVESTFHQALDDCPVLPAGSLHLA